MRERGDELFMHLSDRVTRENGLDKEIERESSSSQALRSSWGIHSWCVLMGQREKGDKEDEEEDEKMRLSEQWQQQWPSGRWTEQSDWPNEILGVGELSMWDGYEKKRRRRRKGAKMNGKQKRGRRRKECISNRPNRHWHSVVCWVWWWFRL